MRILITGGTGLIGRHLCPLLLGAGHTVTVLSRRPRAVPALCGTAVKAIGSFADWQPEQHYDAVINLAGAPIADKRWSATRKRELHDSRVALTDALIARMTQAERPPAVLLSGSAIGYYGGHSNEQLDEAAAPGSDFPARLCCEWEASALAAESLGVRVCLLRSGLVLSPDGGLLARTLPAFRLSMGARVGSGAQWMSWIHIADYLAMLMQMLDDLALRGPYNLTAPGAVTNAEFTRVLAATLGKSAPFVAPTLMLRAMLGEAASLLLDGQRVYPARMERLDFPFRFPELPAALHDLLD